MHTSLRPATPADQPFLEALFIEAHQHEFAPLNLHEVQLKALLQMQARAQRTGYASSHPRAQDRIVLDTDGTPIGRLLVDRNSTHTELIDIVLSASARGLGVGTRLLTDLIEQANGQPIRLQVRPENPAYHLYTRLGFRLIGAGAQLQLEHSPNSEDTSLTLPQTEATNPWTTLIGTSFDVLLDPPAATLTLLLSHVQTYPHLGPRSYALYFHGPLDSQLAQGLFLLRSQSAVLTEQTIFLVPVGPCGNVLEYEAIFN